MADVDYKATNNAPPSLQSANTTPASAPSPASAPAAKILTENQPSTDKILRNSGFATYAWDLETDCISWSPNASEILEAPLDSVATGRIFATLIDSSSGKTPADLVQHADIADSGQGIAFSTDYSVRTHAGADPIWLQDTGRWFKCQNNGSGVVYGVVRRIDARTADFDQLQHMSKFDDVTGQLNRTHLLSALQSTFDDIAVTREPAAFLVLAIDHFTRLNDAFGFDVGDHVISSIAKRIRSHMRHADSIGRLSGNKLGVVLRDCDHVAANFAAERFIEVVRDSVVETPIGPVPATISVGGVLLPRYAQTTEKAVAGALEALSVLQMQKYGSLGFFEPDPEAETTRRQAAKIGDEIVKALNERRVNIALMPIADIENKCIAFHECLVRIVREDGSLLSAYDFVPIAERLGYIRLIDHRVLELALAALQADRSLSLSVNVSPMTAADPEYLSKIVATISTDRQIANRLVVELTETEQIKSLEDATSFVTTLHELGARVAIDDFGAGYTSFRTLQSLEIDIVKIDGSYVFEMAENAADRSFVRALSELADALGITVVAEGVKDQKTLEAVTKLGVTWVQGFGVGTAVMMTQDTAGVDDASTDEPVGETRPGLRCQDAISSTADHASKGSLLEAKAS